MMNRRCWRCWRTAVLIPLVWASLAMADTEAKVEVAPNANVTNASTPAGDSLSVEMLAQLRKAYPATQFDAVRPSEIPGLFEVSMGHNVAYVEPKGRYFLFGHLYDLPANDDITARRQSELVSVKSGTLPLADGIVMRRAEHPKQKLAIFSDPNCGYCRALEKTLATLPDIEVTVYLLPLQEGSEEAAANVWCAPDRSVAWESLMLKGKPQANAANQAKPAKCDTAVFSRNRALAQQLGIHGTPALIANDGRMQPGFLNRPELLAWLNRSSTVTVMEPIR